MPSDQFALMPPADIGKAHYYAYDLECLIVPPLNVEHYAICQVPELATPKNKSDL